MSATRPPDGALHRAPRPLIGWIGVVTGVASLAFLVLLSIPILRAVNRWADGEPVDWQGFAFILTAAGGAAATIMGPLTQWLQNRSNERRTEIVYGGTPTPPPFAPSPAPEPPSGDGLVNNHAIQEGQP